MIAEELEKRADDAVEPVDLADKIEDVRHQILEKLDELNKLRSTLRTSFVPSTVVTHLEQCIKETEVRHTVTKFSGVEVNYLA